MKRGIEGLTDWNVYETEYRSAIFYNSPEQKAAAEAVTNEVQETYFAKQGKKIVTQIVEAGEWWSGEK
jgi:peptide-methionine (S)-S-oxide reductase